jgi:dCTP deaminase
VLCKRQLDALIVEGYISDYQGSELEPDTSSFDLHLSKEGYVLPEGAVKPFGDRFLNGLKQQKLVRSLEPDSSGVFILQPKQTHLFRVKERLVGLAGSSLHGQATAKSSVGRVDVLARLIVDGMDGYESFSPRSLNESSGEMFLEVTSLTFPVRLRAGTSLSQLRLFYAEPTSCEVKGREAFGCFIKESTDIDGSLSVDLTPVDVMGQRVVAFAAKKPSDGSEPISLWKSPSRADPTKYWRFVFADKRQRITLDEGSFYILRSREKLALPAGVAVYCRAIDETLGEMRIHYAGFVHPWFGRNRSDGAMGTPLIFEVRGHDVHTSMNHGAKMARLTFYRMSEDAGKGPPSTYEGQKLKLSQFFQDWPASLAVDDQGNVTSSS